MRKQRRHDEGLALARAYRSSGMTRREFSKKHGVTECSVQYWCKQLHKSGMTIAPITDAKFVEVKSVEVHTASMVKVKVGSAEVSFLSLPEASWMSEFVVSVNRYL